MENRYCLQMVSCGDGCCGNGGSTEAENVYSTEETVCGTWIDGKPIYRKVIPGTLAKDNGDAIVFANVSDLMIDKLINLYGNMPHNDNSHQIVFPMSYSTATGIYAAINMCYQKQTGNILYNFLNNGGTYSGSTAYVVIEYTKQ